jgi:hypothetical protein
LDIFVSGSLIFVVVVVLGAQKKKMSEPEEGPNERVFFVTNIEETLEIISFMTKKELLTGLLRTCTLIYDGYSKVVYHRKFTKEDYEDICSGIGMKLLEKFICIERLSICRSRIEENVCKYLIRRGDMCPAIITNRRKGFNWNRKNYDLLKYSIEQKNIEFINFLLDQIKNANKVPLKTKEKFVDIAIGTKDATILHEICKFFGFETPTRYLTFKNLVEKKLYGKFIDRLKMYVNNKKPLLFRKEDVEEMVDILVERKHHKMMKIVLTYYDGSSVQETPLLRALALKCKDCVKVIIDSGKFDVTVKNNQPIIEACKNGWIDIVDQMIKMKANPAAQGNYPIVVAAKGGFLKLVKYLMCFRCVNPSYDENYALDESLRNWHFDVAELLCSDGRVRQKILERVKKDGRQKFLERAQREGTFDFYKKLLS